MVNGRLFTYLWFYKNSLDTMERLVITMFFFFSLYAVCTASCFFFLESSYTVNLEMSKENLKSSLSSSNKYLAQMLLN